MWLRCGDTENCAKRLKTCNWWFSISIPFTINGNGFTAKALYSSHSRAHVLAIIHWVTQYLYKEKICAFWTETADSFLRIKMVAWMHYITGLTVSHKLITHLHHIRLYRLCLCVDVLFLIVIFRSVNVQTVLFRLGNYQYLVSNIPHDEEHTLLTWTNYNIDGKIEKPTSIEAGEHFIGENQIVGGVKDPELCRIEFLKLYNIN